MYKNVEKAISDMEKASKFMPSKMKSGKYNKNHMKKEDMSMVSPLAASPLEIDCGFNNMNMDMMMQSMCQPMPMDVMQQGPMEMMHSMCQPMEMMQPLDMTQNYPCEMPCPMPNVMMAPEMVQNMVPPCVLNLYTAYPYLNPNR